MPPSSKPYLYARCACVPKLHAMAEHFPVLLIYDDSLHNRWQAEGRGDASFALDSHEDFGRLSRGRSVPCGRSSFVVFNSTAQSLAMHSSPDAVMISNASSMLLSFVFKLSNGVDGACKGAAQFSQGECKGRVCIAARSHGERDDQLQFVPICGDVAGSRDSSDWRQVHVPLRSLGVTDSIEELVFVPGRQSRVSALTPLRLSLDEMWIASKHPPRAGDAPALYGRADINVLRHNWLRDVRPAGAATTARKNSNPHFCEYMSSELGRKNASRPNCRMDGDHLEGRWLQTCDPRLIRRPDHFAYARALPVVQGLYDYRICYRASATERLRTLQALSWSWRPKSCALTPVDGAGFERWLGSRTLLFVGDSLNAQTFYSLIWLLGDAIQSITDVNGVTPEERKKGTERSEDRMDACASSVGNEGGWLSIATLRSGGRMVKVLRHYTIVDELYKLDNAWWKPWLAQADIIMLNVGHHYHAIDKSFMHYGRLAQVATRQLEQFMKPSAQLIFRTTNIGHFGCENASRPLRSRREAWAQLGDGLDLWSWRPPRNRVDMFKDKYSWRAPPLFEHAWLAEALNTRSLGSRFAYLNVSFLDARADGHVATAMRYSSQRKKTEFPLDCLHYCYPGPTDYWALSLYNMLLNNPERYGTAGAGLAVPLGARPSTRPGRIYS